MTSRVGERLLVAALALALAVVGSGFGTRRRALRATRVIWGFFAAHPAGN